MDKKNDDLTPEEKKILLEQGTEPPFSGKLLYEKEEGLYLCRQCGESLFYSFDKFESGTGWPSFDQSIANHILEKKDFERTEILCHHCKGHLGHVFKGELFTKKNKRYCVNSLALSFEKKTFLWEKAVFASGCFWGDCFYV